jgi:hypothetical protein
MKKAKCGCDLFFVKEFNMHSNGCKITPLTIITNAGTMESDRIRAPFTDEQVRNLNDFQNAGVNHPFTCCSPENIPECTRACREIGDQVVDGTSDGKLTATNDGWVCPCGKYRQDWAYPGMAGRP